MAKKRNLAEQAFHMSAARFLDLALPTHCLWTTFPAGGGGKLRGSFLKAMGLRAGWPDIQILVRGTSFDGLGDVCRFIGLELKPEKGGRVSDSQFTTHGLIRNVGGEVYVVKTIEEIYDALIKEGLKLKVKPLMASSGMPDNVRTLQPRTAKQ